VDDARSDLEPAAVAWLDRTRSAVLNVLVVVGAGIAASGWVLGRRDWGALVLDTDMARRASIVVVVAILLASRLVLRVGSGRAALRDPGTRGRRFLRAHVASAIVGGVAVPLGFAYGWAIKPRLEDISPFWVVALATGFLSLPRSNELADFDEPMTDLPAGGPA
jgi:hypothetical protein